MIEKIITTKQVDIDTLMKALEYTNKLLCGTNNEISSKKAKDCFWETINNITFSNTKLENIPKSKAKVIGKTIIDPSILAKEEKVEIQVYHYDFYQTKLKFLHTICHEIWHVYMNIYNSKKCFKKQNTQILYRTIASEFYTIQYKMNEENTDVTYANFKNSYGKSFAEATTDLLAYLSIIINDQKIIEKGITVDDFLLTNLKEMNNIFGTKIKHGYYPFLPVIKLMINAFSNLPVNNYQNIIESGNSIINYTFYDKNNTPMVANDFLYGYVYNPFFVQELYDTFMGKQQFSKLCKKLDNIMEDWILRDKLFITSELEELKNIYLEITNLFYKRMEYLELNEILTKEQIALREQEYMTLLENIMYDCEKNPLKKFGKILSKKK